MDVRGREWMVRPRFSTDYINGVHEFPDKAFATSARWNVICYLYKRYGFRNWYHRDVIYDHLIVDGFMTGYTQWYFHGEGVESGINVDKGKDTNKMVGDYNVDNLLRSTFQDMVKEFDDTSKSRDDSNVEAKKYFRLLEEGKQELYPGYKSFSKLSFVIRLYHLKCLHGISNTTLSNLLELLKEVVPDVKLPDSCHAAKKIVNDLGFNYGKIDSCPNDCILYWGDEKQLQTCCVCETSRWKLNNNIKANNGKKGIAAKVFLYFPFKPRLQRLFMCPKLAYNMLWHAKGHLNDVNLRHPADGKAWKDFDERYPDFAIESRNVRLGLTTDTFYSIVKILKLKDISRNTENSQKSGVKQVGG